MADRFQNPVDIAEQSSSPSSPASGYGKLYPKADGKMYFKNAAGNEYDLTASNKRVITGLTLLDTEWTADGSDFTYVFESLEISSDDVAEIIFDRADEDIAIDAEFYTQIVVSAGELQVWARNEPTDDIGFTLILTNATDITPA